MHACIQRVWARGNSRGQPTGFARAHQPFAIELNYVYTRKALLSYLFTNTLSIVLAKRTMWKIVLDEVLDKIHNTFVV